ncbi:MAG TPA: hypothetical protein DEA44_01780, partial [Firmicutes bacterium]|nr:hypothetical protein [Bacillota bacterium]
SSNTASRAANGPVQEKGARNCGKTAAVPSNTAPPPQAARGTMRINLPKAAALFTQLRGEKAMVITFHIQRNYWLVFPGGAESMQTGANRGRVKFIFTQKVKGDKICS